MSKAKSPINEALENIFLKNILLKSIRAENHHFDVELNPDIKYKVLYEDNQNIFRYIFKKNLQS